LHLLEAMACGRPVIAPKFSGSTEYMTNDNSYPVKYTLVPASCDHKLYKGLWSQTDSDSLVEAMRRVYNNPDECEEKGTLAAEDAKSFSWEATGRRIYSSLMQCGAVVDSKKIRSTEVLAVKVKIVILTWNAFLSTKKYIESFIDYPLPSNADWQFIDNASTDQTIPLLCAWNMPLIRNDANLGFTKAANQGITSCHEDIVLMNNDTIVLHNEWLFQLQKTAYSSDDIGVVGCVIVDQEKNITHCGGELTSTGQGRNIVCKAEECVGIIDREYVTFACVYIKRSTIEKIGLLDESYFAYYEDVDYCFRAKEAGLRVVVDSSVIVLHNENSSSQANKTDLKSLIDQSHKTFESKWTPNCQMLSNHKR
jgi:GT2 family glycosyltransferase